MAHHVSSQLSRQLLRAAARQPTSTWSCTARCSLAHQRQRQAASASASSVRCFMTTPATHSKLPQDSSQTSSNSSQRPEGSARSSPKSSNPNPKHRRTALLAASSGVLALALAFVEPVPSQQNTEPRQQHEASVKEPQEPSQTPAEPEDQKNTDTGLPFFRLAEVKEHGPKSERPWVTYKGKIYDITDWIPAHPGGEVILRAAGSDIEPYWNIFAIHKSQYVLDILESYCIGHVHPDDLANGQASVEDPFLTDPERDARLRFLTQKPCNAETPADELADSFFTPNDTFYVRNHMWVPVIDNAPDYEISVELPDGEVKKYTIAELQTRFKQHAVTAVLQCSGNRRRDMTEHAKKTNGLQWSVGAISCAKWEGVLLRDVLRDAGVSFEPDPDIQHVQFSGDEAYGASIPIESAIDPRGDVLLAFRMNDQPLPRDHGFPVRVIVPGHVAARCVKWLKKIVISDEESQTSWQRRDYKCFGPNETKQDWDKYKSIQKMPITSAITRTKMRQPEQGEPMVSLEGYAYSGGGREIQRVDVSLDGGHTWDQARLLQDDMKLEQGHQAWCWKRWRYEGHLPAEKEVADAEKHNKERKATFVVKATDDAYNTQPQTYESIYNLRGNLATAWHRVDYEVKDEGKHSKAVVKTKTA
ncbi:Oxidoreductase, molybdopterin-binding domain-containing protein [Emericellopsis atlantica]|uniref:Nitrate reductase [NADPH] n=1 Tax=Emericellopsis atlantica TaxID=2614577 RepID=A0A9P8CJR6_9HYPO|nr:Oxidoreductase, molybdopterin-binding domain-containing protein [Emericellopsis atlantica]KAG9249613.1 Oxidoreductase, molybdopterin-binding domain-containing protein [Emericellopsis atlantica]